MERPEFVLDDYLEFLDYAKKTHKINMFGARPYLMQEFPELTKQLAREVLIYWMRIFDKDT